MASTTLALRFCDLHHEQKISSCPQCAIFSLIYVLFMFIKSIKISNQSKTKAWAFTLCYLHHEQKILSCPQCAIFSFIESFFDLHFVLHLSNQSKSLNQINSFKKAWASYSFLNEQSLSTAPSIFYTDFLWNIHNKKYKKWRNISQKYRCNEMKWLNSCINFLYENCTATFVTVQITNPMIQKAGRSVRFESLSFMANWNFSRKWDKWL